MLWLDYQECEVKEVWQWYNGWREYLKPYVDGDKGVSEEWWYVMCMLIN